MFSPALQLAAFCVKFHLPSLAVDRTQTTVNEVAPRHLSFCSLRVVLKLSAEAALRSSCRTSPKLDLQRALERTGTFRAAASWSGPTPWSASSRCAPGDQFAAAFRPRPPGGVLMQPVFRRSMADHWQLLQDPPDSRRGFPSAWAPVVFTRAHASSCPRILRSPRLSVCPLSRPCCNLQPLTSSHHPPTAARHPQFNRANGTKTGRPEVVIAMNRKSLSASNFAFAKSKTRGEQSLVGCLPGGREQARASCARIRTDPRRTCGISSGSA